MCNNDFSENLLQVVSVMLQVLSESPPVQDVVRPVVSHLLLELSLLHPRSGHVSPVNPFSHSDAGRHALVWHSVMPGGTPLYGMVCASGLYQSVFT